MLSKFVCPHHPQRMDMIASAHVGAPVTAALFETEGWPAGRGPRGRRAAPSASPLLLFARGGGPAHGGRPPDPPSWGEAERAAPQAPLSAETPVATVLLFAPAEDIGALRKVR